MVELNPFLIMCHQTMQKLLKKSRKQMLCEHEAIMYRDVCEMIASEARCRKEYFDRQRVLIHREGTNEAATGGGEKPPE